MLDIARDATHDEVETAFFALAKRWHPDRLPAELIPVRDACSRVFARMSEAHATLTDDEQRERYMKLLADGSGSPEMQETVAKVIEAATDFQKAEVCFKRNDLVQAESFCRKAARGSTRRRPTTARCSPGSWRSSRRTRSRRRRWRASRRSTRRLDAATAARRRYFWRGMLYKRLGKNDLAMRTSSASSSSTRSNIDAAREVRLFTMRTSRTSMAPVRPNDAGSGPKSEGEKQGLLGRLFKK